MNDERWVDRHPPDPVLERDFAYDELVHAATLNSPARRAGLRRLAPGDPNASFLIRKLEGTLDPGEGAPMPQGGPPLPANEIERLRSWIAGGAAPG